MKALFTQLAVVGLALATLTACGPRKVNLMSVRMGMDRHVETIAKHEDIHRERHDFLKTALEKTSSPSSIPYPELKRRANSMKKAIEGMQRVNKKIDDFKPRFESYARQQGQVNSDNQGEWEEYQRRSAEYNALVGELNRYSSAFNSDERRIQALLKQYKIGPTSMDAVRHEVSDLSNKVIHGVDEMEQGVRENRKVLKLVTGTGLNPVTIVQKLAVVDQMDDLLPAARLMRSSVSASKDSALKSLAGTEEIWSGPGMKGAEKTAIIHDFRSTYERYQKTRAAYDALNKKFETAGAPTPTPEPAPEAAK